MYKTSKIFLIVGLILIDLIFILFTMDELFYDYSGNGFIEIIFSAAFIFIISFGIVLNFQSLKTFTPTKNIDVIDTPQELHVEKGVLKKNSFKIKLCIINNFLILILLLGTIISLYTVVFEVNKNDEEYIYIIIVWFITLGINILDMISIRLDFLKLKQSKPFF